jgi:hypothetical protein
MAITFRAAGTVATGDGTTTIVLNAPAGIVSTDILIACIMQADATTIATPTGWTLINSVVGSAFGVFWALGNVGTHTFTISGGSATTDSIGFELAYTGVDNVSPIEVNAIDNAQSGTVITSPDITTTTDNDWIVCGYGMYGAADTTFTFSSPQNSRQTGGHVGSGTTDVSVAAGDFAKTPAGATGTHTLTVNVSATAAKCVTAALKPAAAAAAAFDEDYDHMMPTVTPQMTLYAG